MHIEGSIWNDTAWTGPVNWSEEPFIAYYSGFNIDACPYSDSNPQDCYSPKYYWNSEKYQQLSRADQQKLAGVRNNNMLHDYCSISGKRFPECLTNV